MSFFQSLNQSNRSGEAKAVVAVCSAQPDVLKASLLLAKELNQPFLIEATSNQVNQFGGYTGMLPADFIAFVRGLADQIGTDQNLIHFGGDHLGPQVWRSEDAESAMMKAEGVVKAYVEAGFTKIHLDCSEGCAGEPAQVDDETSAFRAARLAAVCEEYAPDRSKIVYVIGTEVPPPGGARAEEVGQTIKPTDPDAARHTLAVHLAAFEKAGVRDAWGRVIGLVVQPGLEFAPTHVDTFDLDQPNLLSPALEGVPHICFEAHSTDYQDDAVYPDLAKRNFSVLKVGPALTYAYRQALYALDGVREVLRPDAEREGMMASMEALMQQSPSNWQKHYAGTDDELRLQRHFGYADRIRYYWPDPVAQAAAGNLFADLETKRPMRPVLEQFFALPVINRAELLESDGLNWPHALVLAQIQSALRPYFF